MKPLLVLLLLAALPGGAGAAGEVRLRPTATLYVDAAGSGMSRPRGVDFDGASTLAVADSGNGRILMYSVDGSRVSSGGEIRLAEVRHPVRVRIGPGEELFILDGRSHRIARVGKDGTFRGFVDLPDSPRGAPLPRSFDLDREGNLFILDPAGGRIVVVDREGGVRREIAYGPEVRSLADVALAGNGSAYAVDAVGRRVFVARDGDLELQPLTGPMENDMRFPTGITADSQGNLFLADDHGSGIVVLGQDGSYRGRQAAMGWRDGFLRYPDGISAGGDLLFVADRGNSRVQVFAVVQ